MGRRVPTRLGDLVREAVGEIAPTTLLAAVQTAWPGAVGEAIAAEARPVSERDGVITVACSSATWANELDLLAGDMLARLRAELPPEAGLAGLRFSVDREPR